MYLESDPFSLYPRCYPRLSYHHLPWKYCNGLLLGFLLLAPAPITSSTEKPQQSFLNSKSYHVTPQLKTLQWFPYHSKEKSKGITIAWVTLHVPACYLFNLISYYSPFAHSASARLASCCVLKITGMPLPGGFCMCYSQSLQHPSSQYLLSSFPLFKSDIIRKVLYDHPVWKHTWSLFKPLTLLYFS